MRAGKVEKERSELKDPPLHLWRRFACFSSSLISICLWLGPVCFAGQAAPSVVTPAASTSPEKIIIDTDIGDDIDDAFALALALRSPELEIIGVTATFGDTEMRARLLDRFLGEVGRADIPVAAGAVTPVKGTFTQRRYAEGGHFAKDPHRDAVDFILGQIRKYPGQITLVALGPLMNVGAAIDKDAATFRKLKRVVLMGGSIKRGYGDLEYGPVRGPQAEWNILNDIPSAQKLFAAGVGLYVMAQGTPITDALTLLYHEWGQETPTLFDPMTIAFLVNPGLCPVQAMRIRVDEKGFTRPEESSGGAGNSGGPANAQVCLDSNPDAFFRFYICRV